MARDETASQYREAARRLVGLSDQIGWASGRDSWRDFVWRLSRGRLGRRTDWPRVLRLPTPWQDTISGERIGWRQRAANLDGESVFEVDYEICRRCGLGWVEQPYTLPQYQRCGLAAAGLASLRADYPDLQWHTLGGHLKGSAPFWAAVGAGVPGGYQQRSVCSHVTPGG